MPLKHIFSHHQSQVNPSESSEDFQSKFPSEINSGDTSEQPVTTERFQNESRSVEQQHRTRRRSSVQILDIKLLHSSLKQPDNESNVPLNAPEDVRKCVWLTSVTLSLCFFFLSHRVLKYILEKKKRIGRKTRQRRRKLCRSRFSIRCKERHTYKHQHLLHHRLSSFSSLCMCYCY
jgi:hypothetical protein